MLYTVKFANGQFFDVNAKDKDEAIDIACFNMSHAGDLVSVREKQS